MQTGVIIGIIVAILVVIGGYLWWANSKGKWPFKE
jgi:flagellar motor component MotA